MNGGKPESELAALRKAAIEALTGTDVDVEGLVTSHTERLTERGAVDILDRIAARGFQIERK